MQWKKIPKSLPPYGMHVLAINENGFILQTRRFKAWDAHWTGQGRDKKRWQYWTELPSVPEDVEKSYDT